MFGGELHPNFGTSLRVRRLRASDASEAAAMMVADLDVPAALVAALPGLLHNLLADGRLAGYRVEVVRADYAARGRGAIGAFGLSGFLSDARTEAFVGGPTPNFAIDILERCLGDESPPGLLSIDAVARANATTGLNLAPICWLQRPRDRTSREGADLMALGMEIFLKQHRGYNLKRIVKEVSADEAARFIAGGFVQVKTLNARDGGKRVALVLTQEQAERDAFGSALGLLFASRQPRLGFSRIQQQVLEGAVEDLSDDEIAGYLGLSAHAVNMRWRTIYDRVDAHPDLAAAIFHPADDRHRGGGGHKRRRIVAFARAHPEELRPFALISAQDRPVGSAMAGESAATG